MVAGLAALLHARASSGQSAATSALTPVTQPAALPAELTARNVSQADRDEVARKLVGSGDPQAEAALLAALNNAGHDAQLSVARAEADAPHPNPDFIEPLANLLGGDRSLDEAAARALARLGDSPAARQHLLDFIRDTRQPAGLRAVVIRACSAIVNRGVATALVNILNDERETATVQNAATDALIDMTGLTDLGREPAAWKHWNDVNATKSDDAWKLTVYTTRDARLDEIAQRHTRLLNALDAVLTEGFQASADKNATVMRYLNATEPEVRAVGARLVRDAFLSGEATPTEGQKLRLTELVGDSDPHVRLETAKTLKAINFAGALDAMMRQLASERDPDVEIALAGAIAQTGDIRAVPMFRRMLKDPSAAVKRAAAEALRSLGAAYYKADPAGAHQLALELWSLYQQRAKDPGSSELQAACIDAIAPLHELSLEIPLVHLLDPDQSERVRAAALRALGDLGDPNTDDPIRTWLGQEPEPSVRLDALDALGKTGTFGADADALYGFFNTRTSEQDPTVRDRAWQVFQALLPTASKQALNNWASTRLQNEPTYRLAVLLALNAKLLQDRDLDNLAISRQNTGDTYMKLGQPDKAAHYYGPALDYWQGQNVSNEVTDTLVSAQMTALLKSRQYSDAATFAAKMIAASSQQQNTMGPLIVQEADALRDSAAANPNTPDAVDARHLIDEALKMKPPLDNSYQDDLRNIQKELQQKPQQ
jgi:HEAT repeat protein